MVLFIVAIFNCVIYFSIWSLNPDIILTELILIHVVWVNLATKKIVHGFCIRMLLTVYWNVKSIVIHSLDCEILKISCMRPLYCPLHKYFIVKT